MTIVFIVISGLLLIVALILVIVVIRLQAAVKRTYLHRLIFTLSCKAKLTVYIDGLTLVGYMLGSEWSELG